MRCSSFELHLDAYVEGSLSAASRARADAHVKSCAACAALLTEFRVVDGLLLSARRLEPPPNFTRTVMADVRTLQPPRERRAVSFGAVLATYIAFGWLTIGAFVVYGGSHARAAFAALAGGAQRSGTALQSLATVTGSSFGARRYDVTAAMAELLGADVLVALAVVALYTLRRARRNDADRAERG